MPAPLLFQNVSETSGKTNPGPVVRAGNRQNREDKDAEDDEGGRAAVVRPGCRGGAGGLGFDAAGRELAGELLARVLAADQQAEGTLCGRWFGALAAWTFGPGFASTTVGAGGRPVRGFVALPVLLRFTAHVTAEPVTAEHSLRIGVVPAAPARHAIP